MSQLGTPCANTNNTATVSPGPDLTASRLLLHGDLLIMDAEKNKAGRLGELSQHKGRRRQSTAVASMMMRPQRAVNKDVSEHGVSASSSAGQTLLSRGSHRAVSADAHTDITWESSEQ